MKKLIAFLLAAIMLLSLCACGYTNEDDADSEFYTNEDDADSEFFIDKKDPFLHPVDFYDREYTERFFGDMGEWEYDEDELEIENYELNGQKREFEIENYEMNGQKGEFEIEYRAKNGGLSFMGFFVDFRDHEQDVIIDDEEYHEMTSDEIYNTRQYYNEACSYYESYFGSPYEVYSSDSDHEESTIWILDSEVGDLYFVIYCDEDYGKIGIYYDDMDQHNRKEP